MALDVCSDFGWHTRDAHSLQWHKKEFSQNGSKRIIWHVQTVSEVTKCTMFQMPADRSGRLVARPCLWRPLDSTEISTWSLHASNSILVTPSLRAATLSHNSVFSTIAPPDSVQVWPRRQSTRNESSKPRQLGVLYYYLTCCCSLSTRRNPTPNSLLSGNLCIYSPGE